MSCYAHFLYNSFIYVHNFLYNFLYTRRRDGANKHLQPQSQLAPGCTSSSSGRAALSNAPRSHVVRALHDLRVLPHNFYLK